MVRCVQRTNTYSCVHPRLELFARGSTYSWRDCCASMFVVSLSSFAPELGPEFPPIGVLDDEDRCNGCRASCWRFLGKGPRRRGHVYGSGSAPTSYGTVEGAPPVAIRNTGSTPVARMRAIRSRLASGDPTIVKATELRRKAKGGSDLDRNYRGDGRCRLPKVFARSRLLSRGDIRPRRARRNKHFNEVIQAASSSNISR